MSEKVRVLVNGELFSVTVIERTRESVAFEIDGRNYQVEIAAEAQSNSQVATPLTKFRKSAPVSGPSGVGWSIVAPIPGVVVELLVAAGDSVHAGDVVARLEAMKMQNNILATSSGRVTAVLVSVGDEVTDSQPLLELGS